MTRVAVVLFNLGGPDRAESIKPFLKNFFMDKNIIQAPWPVRAVVSSLIARRRSKNEAGTSYGLMGGKSPLLENTLAQGDALQFALNRGQPEITWRVFTAMRYWHPMSDAVVRDVLDFAPERIVLLPLYPQFSTTTTRSSIEAWNKAAAKAGLRVATTTLCCYPFNAGFIASSARLVSEAYSSFIEKHDRVPRVLFSAHGLPEKIIQGGDPYQWQCEESAARIAAATGIADLDWKICYQSRVGPLKWIGPSTEDALREAAADQVPVLIYPHAFVSEHVETLVEIEIEYREEAHKMGVPGFARVPTVGVAAEFIEGLRDIVIRHCGSDTVTMADGAQRICPQHFTQCCMNAASHQTRKVA